MMKDKKKSEAAIQAQCYQWFHNTYPFLRGLLCYNLNNPKNLIDGNLCKAMGLQKGRSDLVLYFHGTAFMIEMKDDKGVQFKAQKEWQAKVEENGFEYYIIRDLESFKKLIQKIIGRSFGG